MPKPADPAPNADDRFVQMAEERLTMVRELAEMGMAVARELTRRLVSPDPFNPDPPCRKEPAELLDRISRSVRLTLALESKLAAELKALLAGDAPAEDKRKAEPIGPLMAGGIVVPAYDGDDLCPDYPSAFRNRIRDNVHDAINQEIRDVHLAHEALDHLYERLIEGDRYDAFIHRPLREIVENICADLGLKPDWSDWGEDGWPVRDYPPGVGYYDWPMMWGPSRSSLDRRRADEAKGIFAKPEPPYVDYDPLE